MEAGQGANMSGDKGVEGSSESVVQLPADSAVGSRSVFLSYASPDAEVTKQICQFLENHGVSCWMAPRDVKPGAVYADAIAFCRVLLQIIWARLTSTRIAP